jgi:hypothetical protein
MTDNYTVTDIVEIYYPRGATVFASVCAVLFSIVGVMGKYSPLKSDNVLTHSNDNQRTGKRGVSNRLRKKRIQTAHGIQEWDQR